MQLLSEIWYVNNYMQNNHFQDNDSRHWLINFIVEAWVKEKSTLVYSLLYSHCADTTGLL